MASTITTATLAALATATLPAAATRPLPEIQARFHERILIDGARMDADVTGRLLSATLTRGYDQATSLELVFDDHDMRILTSGLISRQGKVRQDQFDQADWARFGEARLVLDGVAFRLAGANPSYNASQRRITLRFEDEIAVLMRRKKGPRRFRRGKVVNDPLGGLTIPSGRWTRSLAIAQLIYDATHDRNVGMVVGMLDNQPIKGDTAKAKHKEREKGLAKWRKLTVKTVPITATQKQHLETALTVADEQGASERAAIAMICAAIGESTVSNVVNSAGYGGVFQGQVAVPRGTNWFAPMSPFERTREEAKSFLLGGRGFQGGGAIALAREHPDWGPGEIATTVEAGGAAPGFYGVYSEEAQAILDAWGGNIGVSGVGRVKVREQPFNFVVAKDQTYFDAAGQFASDVRWRFWVDENEAWYAPDDWLFQSTTTLEISPDMPGFRGIDGTNDVGVPVGELALTVNVPRWIGKPAWRVETDGMGPLNGLWLLAQHEQDLFTEDSTITLHRPAPKLKEKAATTTIITQGNEPASGGGSDPLSPGYPLADRGRLIGLPGVGTHSFSAPPNNWQSDNAIDIGIPVGTSVFAVQDGVISPDGLGFGELASDGGRFNGLRLHLKSADNVWYYAHLSRILPSIKPGTRVQKGQLIGRSGSANGVAHLHIACLRSDPKTLLWDGT